MRKFALNIAILKSCFSKIELEYFTTQQGRPQGRGGKCLTLFLYKY